MASENMGCRRFHHEFYRIISKRAMLVRFKDAFMISSCVRVNPLSESDRHVALPHRFALVRNWHA